MESIYADYSISMTEFKKNPVSVLRDAMSVPEIRLDILDAEIVFGRVRGV